MTICIEKILQLVCKTINSTYDQELTTIECEQLALLEEIYDLIEERYRQGRI